MNTKSNSIGKGIFRIFARALVLVSMMFPALVNGQRFDTDDLEDGAESAYETIFVVGEWITIAGLVIYLIFTVFKIASDVQEGKKHGIAWVVGFLFYVVVFQLFDL